MGIFEMLTASLAGKLAAALSGLTIIGGGFAGVVELLPEDAQGPVTEAYEQVPQEIQDLVDGILTLEAVEVPEQLPEEGDSTAQIQAELEEPIEEPTEEPEAEEPAEDDADERSETARRVHEALTGDPDLKPGDEGFGEAVSNNAKNGGRSFGQGVADAASGGRAGGPGAADGDSGAAGGPPAGIGR